MNTQPSWPLDHPDHLAEALREQAATPEEIADLMPVLLRLTEWQAPTPTAADTHALLTRLTPLLSSVSPVRQALRTRQQSQRRALFSLLETARVQVSILRLSFWLLSALVTFLGVVAVLYLREDQAQAFLLRALGPFLAYLGATSAFRGAGLRVLEFELACPPSPAQLALARLLLVLSYDAGLGFALGLALWAAGTGSFLMLTLFWLMPLLLVAGLALLLSLRLPVQAAAALAYGGWLAALVLERASGPATYPPLPLNSAPVELLIGALGLALLAIALLRLRAAAPRLLPR